MIKIKPIIAVTLLLFAGFVQAATVTKQFEAVVTLGGGGGVKVGTVFQGQFYYDDTALNLNGDTVINQPDINFDWFGGSVFSESATLSPTGALVNLIFSIDVPNTAIFSAGTGGLNPLEFHFEVPQGGGSGIIREPGSPVVPTPLPAGAWLFISGLGLLARLCRTIS